MSFWKTKEAQPPKAASKPVPEQRQPSEAETAHARALANLEAARSRGPEVKRVASSLRGLRERNHFAAQIEHLFTGGHA